MAKTDIPPINLDWFDNIVGVHWDTGDGDYVIGTTGSFECNRWFSRNGLDWRRVSDTYYKYQGNTYNSQHNDDGLGGGWVDNPYQAQITACTYDTKRKRFMFGGAGLTPNEPDEYPVHGDLINLVRVDQSKDGRTWLPRTTANILTPPFIFGGQPVGFPAWMFYDEPSDTTFMCVTPTTNVGIGPAQYYKSVNGGGWARYGTDSNILAPYVEPGVANFATGITDWQTGRLKLNGENATVKVKTIRYYPSFGFPKWGPPRVSFNNGPYVPITPPAGTLADLRVGDGVIACITFTSDDGSFKAYSSDDALNWGPVPYDNGIYGGPRALAWGKGGMVIVGNWGDDDLLPAPNLRAITSADGLVDWQTTLELRGIGVFDEPRGGVPAATCRPLIQSARPSRTRSTTRR